MAKQALPVLPELSGTAISVVYLMAVPSGPDEAAARSTSNQTNT